MSSETLRVLFKDRVKEKLKEKLKIFPEGVRLWKETVKDFRSTVKEVWTQPARSTPHNIECRKRLVDLVYFLIVLAGLTFMIVSVGVAFYVSRADAKKNEAGVERDLLQKRAVEVPSDHALMWDSIAFGVVAFLAYVARMLNRGWVLKKFHLEDGLMSLTMILFACHLVLINFSARFPNILYPMEEEAEILANPLDVKYRVIGSQLVVAVEQSMLAVSWCVKICVWTFLLRLYSNVDRYQNLLWCQFIFLWAGLFIIVILYYFGWCVPIEQYWTLPVTNSECATYHNYSIVEMVFNIISNVGLILTPLPMIWGAQLPLKRLLVLTGILGLGVFAIVAAAISKYYNFLSPHTPLVHLWYLREAAVSITAANLLCTWQLLQHLFHFRSFSNTRFEITDDGTVQLSHGLRHTVNRIVHRARQSVSFIPGFGYGNTGVSAFAFGNAGVNVRDDAVEDDSMEMDRRRGEDRRRDTQFSVERDGDDARPAILYRSMHNIA